VTPWSQWLVEAYHDAAMYLCDAADERRRKGRRVKGAARVEVNADVAATLAAAARAEASAAGFCDEEPSRAVLFRSAAWLALDAGDARRAARLARKGLEGVRHAEIETELREVLGATEGWR
jgi:hypothetical protein